MRRHLLVLSLAILAFTTVSAAAAQNWVGLRSGYPLGVTIHYGMANALRGADLRISGRVSVSGSNTYVGLGLDALWNVYREGPLTGYVGAGPSMEFGTGRAELGLNGLGGIDFRVGTGALSPLSIFVEGQIGGALSLSGGSARIPTFGAAVGVNWRLN